MITREEAAAREKDEAFAAGQKRYDEALASQLESQALTNRAQAALALVKAGYNHSEVLDVVGLPPIGSR